MRTVHCSGCLWGEVGVCLGGVQGVYTCKNITFPQLLLRMVNIKAHAHRLNANSKLSFKICIFMIFAFARCEWALGSNL